MDQEFIKKELHQLFEKTLDSAEFAITNNNMYDKFRGRFLRIGNDCLRNLLEEEDAGERRS